ncbi:glycoside hydrolase family 31 protein [Algoriphagus vanfongensis]|uniref:glycoside hydrolase family 31 protein n=1 Tax=Algoriphagus vanfongensis TaxID=426371 RepID=UPI001FE04941|nr:TIM-barrel domain-containing protein [Algoriphagus vanfongensis]
MGRVIQWKKTPRGIKGESEWGFFVVSVFDSQIIRVQASRWDQFYPNPYSVVYSPTNPPFDFTESEEYLELSTQKLSLRIKLSSFSCTFLDKNGSILNEDDPLGISWIGTEVSCYKKLQSNEKFIGLGEKTGNLNRAGNAYTNWNTDYFAYGVGDDPLYMSIPFYIGIHEKGAYGVFFDNTHKSVFNFGASTNRFTYFSAEDGEMDYYFIHDPQVKNIISKYTELTGRMELPPKWALGFQQCRYSYYPESEVKTLANTFRDKKMPADVIYLDIHHMESYKVFTFDQIKFPDPKALISYLKEKGFKVIVILDPGIKADSSYLPYQEGKSSGLFVPYPDGEEYQAQVWPGWCALPDFTQEKTREWWSEKMKFYTDAGVDGFWTDMNEPASWGQCTPNLLEFDWEGDKASHRKARNVYGMQMARSTKEGNEKQAKQKRSFVLTRSGFAGIQRYAAAWTGDNVASEAHMLAGIRLVNSLGISGVSFAGYDVGGFVGDASPALFARWMSIAAFSPLYRAHSMINTRDAEPWAFGEEVEEISRNYLQLRYQLLPTIYAAFYSSTQTGLPLAESLAISNPQDPKVFESAFQNQYLFCESFLIAPVESTKEITKVYLPHGNWYNLYTDEFFTGGKEIYVDCPLNYLPVFAKAGAIYAMQSEVLHTSQNHDQILRIHVYLSDQGSTFHYYEDDGISKTYQKGAYYKRSISYDPQLMELKFSPKEGDFKSTFKKTKLYLHGFHTEVLSVNGESQKLELENFAFLNKLTEFDPLPEKAHPYHEISDLKVLELELIDEEIAIAGLF